MPPRIKGRGQRGMSIPKGYLLGRISRGAGDAELLNLRDLRAFGVGGTNEAVAALLQAAGFRFYIQGLMSDGELIGAGTWVREVTFTDGDSDTSVFSAVAATAPATIKIMAPDIYGIPQQVGSIIFGAGGTIGVVSWVSGSYTNPAGRVMSLVAPSPADVSLADITGLVTGVGD